MTPASTYRLQFGPRFRLHDGLAIVDYLHALGITHVYASPLLGSRRGSPHGYDVTDTRQIDRELGGEEAFDAFVDALRARGMGLVLDIVPNHMAASTENAWWRDVLRHGPASPYAEYFDIEWEPARPGLRDKVMLPILEAHYGAVLEQGGLRLELVDSGLEVRYQDHRLPVAPRSHATFLRHGLDHLRRRLSARHAAPRRLAELADAFGTYERASGDLDRLLAGLIALRRAQPEVEAHLAESLRTWNGVPGDARSFDLFDALLEQQAYRLAFWQVASQELNYRRFFDISDLVSLHVEDERVFADTHALVLRLMAAGRIDGLRIDHVDGLQDPWRYLTRLRERVGPDAYLVVEKILDRDEELPADWPVQGATGYEMLNDLTALFLDPQGIVALDRAYERRAGRAPDFGGLAYAAKRAAFVDLFGGELRNLASQLGRLAEAHRHGRDLTLTELGRALVDLTAALPVYRTYVRELALSERDRGHIERAAAEAARRDPEAAAAIDFVRRALLLDLPPALDDAGRRRWLRFVNRWQQLAAAVMAKGQEDTALYRFGRLAALNEVGSDPAGPGLTPSEFHLRMSDRFERWPDAMSSSATHDTKRGEDTRARIGVITQLPEDWEALLERWRPRLEARKRRIDGRPVPDGDLEMLLLQTIVGAWPLVDSERDAFPGRMREYAIKAAREAKRETSWVRPNAAYEEALGAFVEAVVRPAQGDPVAAEVEALAWRLARHSAIASLGATLLKIAAPGVPDTYQGAELWDLSVVDPDNRRPVDFALRARLLAELDAAAVDPRALARELFESWEDGRLKLYVTAAALRLRRERRALFARGQYVPLDTEGSRAEHLVAFARRSEEEAAAVVATRLSARLAEDPRGHTWADTRLSIGAPGSTWRDVLTGRVVPGEGARLSALLEDLPVALLVRVSG